MRLALSGKMVSGKSLVAKRLVERHGFLELNFADRIKALANELFGARIAKDRMLLVALGERLREIDNAVWVRAVLRHIPLHGDVIVADMRFPKEHEALGRIGFSMVRMVTDRAWQEQTVSELYPDMPAIMLDDYSETALDSHPFDYHIVNLQGTPLEKVYEQVDAMISELRKGALR